MNSARLEFSLMMLLRRARRRLPMVTPLYRLLARRYERAGKPVPVILHGFDSVLNPGNTYPYMVQDVIFFNAPLIELVHQTYRTKGKGITLVDVGAAVGDTVLLLKERCPGRVAKFKCVEGDAEFCALLATNTAQFDDVEIIGALLARDAIQIRSLVKHHKGTAAATGDEYIKAVDLDSIKTIRADEVDILKVDVDGFDGEVLSGARQLLSGANPPAVIFEWHPKLIQKTGNDAFAAFDLLRNCGYQRYLWFNNSGTFSHFSNASPLEILARERDYLVKTNSRADDHFDVVALPACSKIDDVELAAMEYALSKAHLGRSIGMMQCPFRCKRT